MSGRDTVLTRHSRFGEAVVKKLKDLKYITDILSCQRLREL